jgi:hypothetical protein
MTSTRRFRVLLVSANGYFVAGHHEYVSDGGLPRVGDTINVQATEQRTRTLCARVTSVDRGHPIPIAATEIEHGD